MTQSVTDDAGPQVGECVTDDGAFRSAIMKKTLGPHPMDVVTRSVLTLRARGVHHRLGLGFDQSTGRGQAENRFPERVESPFFRRRSWAYGRVE